MTDIADIFAGSPTIAIVGASPNPGRPSYHVMAYLIAQGFNVIPVRPKVSEIQGRKCYSCLEDVPEKIHIVDVFRKSEACPEVARSAVTVGARVLWLQEGVVSDEAAEIAGEAGIAVVMDACIKKEHAAGLESGH